MVLGGRTRQKRIARSQIPTKPVEMPACVDALDIEVSGTELACMSDC